MCALIDLIASSRKMPDSDLLDHLLALERISRTSLKDLSEKTQARFRVTLRIIKRRVISRMNLGNPRDLRFNEFVLEELITSSARFDDTDSLPLAMHLELFAQHQDIVERMGTRASTKKALLVQLAT